MSSRSPTFDAGSDGNSNYPTYEGNDPNKDATDFASTSEKPRKRLKRGDATELVDQLLDTTRGLSAVVSGEAKEIAGRVSKELSASAEAGVDKGADALSGLVRAMQIAGREIEGEAPALARNIDRAAEQVENFAESIRGRSVTELFSNATELAKRHPTTFLAGAVLAGFAVSRFLRSGPAQGPVDPTSGTDRPGNPL